jgi:hypothetical protein
MKDPEYTIDDLKEKIDQLIFNYLRFHSSIEITQYDAEEEAGAVANQTTTLIQQVEEAYKE